MIVVGLTQIFRFVSAAFPVFKSTATNISTISSFLNNFVLKFGKLKRTIGNFGRGQFWI